MRVLHRNLIEEATALSVRGSATGYPSFRLYDRRFGRVWVSNQSSGFEHVIVTGFPSSTINGLIIPSGHNLNGSICTIAKLNTYTSLLSNGGFETAGGGGADVFANWSEAASDGTIIRTTTSGEYRSGVAACKLTAGASLWTTVSQNVSVSEGQVCSVSGYARGDGTNSGRVGIYDVTNAAWVVEHISLGITAASPFANFGMWFVVPDNCSTIQIVLAAPTVNGGMCCFDDLVAARYDTVTSWTQSGSGLILKEFTSFTETGLLFGITGFSSAPQLSELFAGEIVDLVNPYEPAVRQYRRFAADIESPSGDPQSLLLGDAMKTVSFRNTIVPAADLSDWEDWFDIYRTSNRFFFVDQNSEQYFAMFVEPPIIEDLSTGNASVGATIRQVAS